MRLVESILLFPVLNAFIVLYKIKLYTSMALFLCKKHLNVRFPRRLLPLKLDLCDKNNPKNKLKIRILSETSIPYLIRHASFILIVGLHL